MLEDYLKAVVEPILMEPEQLKIVRTQDQMGVLLTVDVSKNDMGRIIGRSGETAKSLRTLMRVVGSMNQAKVSIKINEPQGSRYRDERAQLNEALGDLSTKPISGSL